MSDLTSIFAQQNPMVGAVWAGEQRAINERNELMKNQELAQTIQKMQQEAAQSAQMNPLKLEHQRHVNSGLEYGLPGIQAESQKKVLDTQEAQQTSGNRVAADNSKNRLQVLGDSIKQGQMVDGVLTKATAEIESLPPMLRASRMREIAQEHGLDVNNPRTMQIIQQASRNPQILLQIKQKVAQKMTEMQPEYIKELMKEQEATKRNTATTNATRYAAEKSAESRMAVAASKAAGAGDDILKRVKEGRVSPANAATQFELLAALSESEADRAKYNRLAETFNKLALQLNPKPQNPDLGAAGIPTAQPPTPVAGQGGPQKPKGTGTAADPIVLE